MPIPPQHSSRLTVPALPTSLPHDEWADQERAGDCSPASQHKPLWQVKQCADFLGRSPRWIWSALTRRADEAGSIPHFHIGRSPRFFPDDIVAWVRAGCPPAATFTEWKAAQEKSQKRRGGY
jgi:hypothetical protein